MKKLFLLLAITLAIGITGCSSNNANSSKKDTSKSSKTQKEDTQKKDTSNTDSSEDENTSNNEQTSANKRLTVSYKDGTKAFEALYDSTNIELDKNTLESAQNEINLTYKTETKNHTFTLTIDSHRYTSKEDFREKNIAECKKMFVDGVASGITEINCGGIRFYKIVLTYTSGAEKKKVFAPLYYAEIEPGSYIYIELTDTLQYNKLDENMLKITEQMLQELFLGFNVVK